MEHSLHQKLRSGASPVAAFALSALLALLLLNWLTPNRTQPDLGLLGKKIEYLQNAHHDYNVLVIGTSEVYRSVDPTVLNRAAQKQGCDINVFNLGVPNLSLPELEYIRRSLPPEMFSQYDLIVLSPLALVQMRQATWRSDRVLHFIDWPDLKTHLIDIWTFPELTLGERIDYAALATGAFVYRKLGIGRFSRSFRQSSDNGNSGADVQSVDGGGLVDFSRGGFVALDKETALQYREREGRFDDEKQQQRFRQLLIGESDSDRALLDTGKASWRRYSRSIGLFEDLNTPVLFVVPPSPKRLHYDQALAEYANGADLNTLLLNYNQPLVFPEVFREANWFDLGHVNESGAALFSKHLGSDICALIKGTHLAHVVH